MTTRKPADTAPAAAPGATRTAAPASSPAPGGVPAREASADTDVATFIAKMKSLAPAATGERGRLVFAMDATMSRAPTWDMALKLQGEMFAAVKEVGGLDVQLIYFRGMGECRASKWVSDPEALARLMRVLGVPVFAFQEGGDETAARAFREIARLTKGAFCRFDPGSARQLRDLLTAVAVYAAGGRKALLALSGKSEGGGARLLLEQLSSGAAGA